ncbi:dihydrofolate reductase family protein [Gymnodinialimonas sp. 2305UL16-5]|uniref:dihydrofolate reductase family protein n=1 Tax=Gymnodinialimonas mytili TaxID=3126503 RepID=UPI0030B5F405
MHPIIYDVAVSADGYICGPDADVSAFPHSGPIVDDYMARLQNYAVALMGRATYEFGLAHGLPPGANPYPHMRSIVVSSKLELPETSEIELWRDLSALNTLRQQAEGPIYLCGGGVLAQALAQACHLSELRLKRAPCILGSGIPLFAPGTPSFTLSLLEQRDYGNGLLYQAFRIP